MKTRQSILGLFAFAAAMVVAGAAYASCGISDRLTFHHSECVHGWWDNNEWPKKSTFGAQVQNDCHLWGKVVVKVDLASCSDKTWHFTNANTRRGSEACRVRGIYCCQDLSDLCDRDDMVTRANCEIEWNKSSASESCTPAGGTTYTSGSTSPVNITAHRNESACGINAKCEYITPEWTLSERQTYIRVFFLTTKDLVNCNGDLKKPEDCPFVN